MRVFPTGRGLHPDASAALHVWTFAQTGVTDSVRDVAEPSDVGNLLVATGSPAAAVAAPVETARTFGTGKYAAGYDDGTDAASMLGACTVMAWVKPASGYNATGIVVNYKSESNCLIGLRIKNDLTLQAFWEQGAQSEVNTATTATIPAGEWTHVALVRSAGSPCTLTWYVNGVQVGAVATGLTQASPADIQRWVVGIDGRDLATQPFNGSICSVGVWTSVLTAAQVGTAFRRGCGWVYGSTVHCRVDCVDGNGNFVDVGTLQGFDWLVGVDLKDDVDARSITATVHLFREASDNLSLAKYHDNRLNRTPAGATGPDAPETYTENTTEFLALNRRIRVYVARMPFGLARPAAGSADWQMVLDGVIDDVEWGDEITVQCQDLIGQRLTKGYLQAEANYGTAGGTAVEGTSAMQGILNDAYSNGWVAADPATAGATTLYTPTSPSWNVKTWRQRREPVLQSLTALAEQIGWKVKRKWRSDNARFDLTLHQPDRTKSIFDAVLTTEEYFSISRLGINMAGIRNVIRVCYTSQETSTPSSGVSVPSGFTRTSGWEGPDEQQGSTTFLGRRGYVEWTNTASVTKYGQVFMEVAEAATSQIDTVTEADKMALAMLRDLMEPKADHAASTIAIPELEVGDYLTWKANDRHYTGDQSLAVVAVSHAFGRDGCKTEVTCRGTPSGGHRIHGEKESRGGNAPPPVKSADEVLTAATWRKRNVVHKEVLAAGLNRGGRQALVINPDFASRLFRGDAPPDGWSLFAGTWATDVDTSTANANVLSGERVVDLKTATGQLRSVLFPVKGSGIYQVEAVWKADSATTTRLVVEWYQGDKTTAASVSETTALGPSVGTSWVTDRNAKVDAPSNARWGRIRLERDAGGSHVYVDRIGIALRHPAFSVYRNTDQTGIVDKTWTQVQVATEEFDYGNNVASYYFTAPETGLYEFEGGVQVASVSEFGQAALYKDTGGGDVLWVLGSAITNDYTNRAHTTVRSGTRLLSRGDKVSLWVFTSDGSAGAGTAKAGAGLTYLTGRLLATE